ncbi:TPA: helix-turn-helix domain-containing protein, partial [Enterococcus faecium]|nr:helix-turn-helix domain-containing protein [Enterococcus faecium]HCI0314238.1 helix-turn-helix domain-containing protein [Enterococcus faecium]HCI0319932.1 helix-turn-helix domain-containing protein [Enterococcus faecium]HCI0349891.1 helix-turn-helix domain-containing protein [Enterococcus faecium]HCI0352852.1 helix-turn-helix domain-containing protein [Enterococcus faecium]
LFDSRFKTLQQNPVNQICEITNVSRASLYRKLSEVNN